MKIKLTGFQGLVPRIAPRLLSDTQAQVATNLDLKSGNIKPLAGLSDVATLPDSSRISIYSYNGAWLSWTTDVDVVKSPIADDQRARIYYTGDDAPKVRGVLIRENSTAYTLGQKARWETGTTVWEVTTGGTSAAAAPSISGKGVGDTVTDGTVVWEMTSLTLVDADESEYTLGLPVPTNTPTITASDKASVTWTRSWYYYYEEPDGTVSQTGTLTEGAYSGTNVNEVTPGKSYRIETIPTKTTASADAKFILWFTAASADGASLGTCYPATSQYASNTDFVLDGASGTSTQVNSSTSPECTLTITYDTSRAADYTVSRAYVYTFVTDWGEEGPPSSPSTAVDIDPTQDAVVSNMDTSVTGYANVTKKRIYRTVTTNAGTDYYYVAEIDLATTSYTDSLTDDETDEVLPSANWDAPDSSLKGVVSMPGGFLAAFKGKTVFFSAINQPHAWPEDYAITIDEDIVGLQVSENTLVVGTEGIPYAITGYEPDAMSVAQLSIRQACVSKRGMARIAETVVYPSPDGLVAVQAGLGTLVTESFYTREQWNAIDPDTMIGEVHDGIYHGWTDSTGIIFDFGEGASTLVETDETTAGLYSDDETDVLYLIQGDAVKGWRQGSSNLTGTWRGKIYQLPRRWSPSVTQVVANTYPVTLNLYANENATAVLSLSVTNDKARKLKVLRDEKTWEIEVVSDDEIESIVLSTSMQDL